MTKSLHSAITNEEWLEVKALFDRAVGLSLEEREAVLKEVTGQKPLIAKEVESLLKAYDETATTELKLVMGGAASVKPDVEVPAAPRQVFAGRYSLIRKLGHGGMAEVYLALRNGEWSGDRRMALKCLPKQFAANEDFRRMFEYEAQLSSRLVHPNIVRVHSFDAIGEFYVLAMEYVSGKDLFEISGRNSGKAERLPVGWCVYIISEVCKGLEYAHMLKDAETGLELRVVHRDISPGNIMVGFDGSVKLLDFGIAEATNRSRFTQPGLVRGTPRYMPPERFLGRPADQGGDLFSLSAVLFELCSGKEFISPEFQGVDAYSGEVIPPELVEILRKGLARLPSSRYQTAKELLGDLRPLLRANPRERCQQELREMMARKYEKELSSDKALREVNSDPLMRTQLSEIDPAEAFGHATPNFAVPSRRPTRWRRWGASLLIFIALLLGIEGGVSLWLADIEQEIIPLGKRNSKLAMSYLAAGVETNKCILDFRTVPPGARIKINYALNVGTTPSIAAFSCQAPVLISLSAPSHRPVFFMVEPHSAYRHVVFELKPGSATLQDRFYRLQTKYEFAFKMLLRSLSGSSAVVPEAGTLPSK